MTPLPDDQIRALLAVAMGYDNRRPGELNVAAWREGSARGRWTLAAAAEAIHQHYARSTDFLMPAHITQLLAADRRQPAPATDHLLESPPPADDERIRTIVAEVAANLGWTDQSTRSHDPERRVRCPYEPCGAGPGQPCVRRVGNGAHRGEVWALSSYHASRAEAAKADPP